MDVTFVIVHHGTPMLTSTAVSSILRHQAPSPKIIVIDNGSGDLEVLESSGLVTMMRNRENLGHGPGMHQGFQRAETDWVFTLDSDAVLTQTWPLLTLGGEGDQLPYAIGGLSFVDETGHDVDEDYEGPAIPYIHPRAALWHRDSYFILPPFIDHGCPCLDNMRAVRDSGDGHRLIDFSDIRRFMHHAGRGSWNKGLSWTGKKRLSTS